MLKNKHIYSIAMKQFRHILAESKSSFKLPTKKNAWQKKSKRQLLSLLMLWTEPPCGDFPSVQQHSLFPRNSRSFCGNSVYATPTS